jgi:hypothetical protein
MKVIELIERLEEIEEYNADINVVFGKGEIDEQPLTGWKQASGWDLAVIGPKRAGNESVAILVMNPFVFEDIKEDTSGTISSRRYDADKEKRK